MCVYRREARGIRENIVSRIRVKPEITIAFPGLMKTLISDNVCAALDPDARFALGSICQRKQILHRSCGSDRTETN